MIEKAGGKKEKKGFFFRMFEKLDKLIEEKAKEGTCCSGSDKSKGKSCCS